MLVVPEANRVNWLRQLIQERISPELELQITHQTPPTYRLVHAEKYIEMPVWLWENGKTVHDIDWFDVREEGWQGMLDAQLPAPGISCLKKPVINASPQGYTINYDVLGFAYWMLSRAEEVGRTTLDEHHRFPATSSHAFLFGYLSRPVVDEWFEILRQVVHRLWGEIQTVVRLPAIRVSHDVDEPSRFGFRTLAQLGRAAVGDILKRRDPRTAISRLLIGCASKKQIHPSDPCNTFDWIMDISDEYSLTSTFFFVCGRTDASRDPLYDLEHPIILSLIKRIHERGHEIGLHPSYCSFNNPEVIAREALRLIEACGNLGVHQDAWGARMHYLRWETPTTLNGLARAGIKYDHTLGYADIPGFRCGTCIEYTAYDPVAQNAIDIRVRPLIVMDRTIMSDTYLGLGTTASSYEKFKSLRDVCRKVGGDFNLLWHNSQLVHEAEREMYEALIGS